MDSMENPYDHNNAAFASRPTSPPPTTRQRSMTAATADKMHKRSASRATEGTLSKYSGDDESNKTAVKVGACFRLTCHL